MLRITPQQWSELGDSAQARFEQRMVAHMKVRSRLGLAPDVLQARTRQLLAHARAHGITQELHQRRFLEMVFDGIDRPGVRAELGRILELPGLSSAARISFIAEAVAA